jgi:glutathione peroxidase
MLNEQNIKPRRSVYDIKVQLNNGKDFDLHSLEGKPFLIVNTASECGYTEQYDDLQKLHAEHGLTIIGFPSNDFGSQEPGNDEQIASFCKVNYGVTFPLSKKTTVIKVSTQHPLFKWLSETELNGWNDTEPTWNFCKYLIDEEGKLKGFFGSSVQPGELIEHL